MRMQQVAIISIFAIGLALFLPVRLVAEASAFSHPDLLSRKINATAIKGESIDQVLDRLPSEYGIPIGIELGNEKLTPRREIDLDVPKTNLKEFLDAVIVKDPRYTWKLEGDVIHVWPLTGRDTLVATLLEAKISHFAIVGETTWLGVYNDVMNLPEIKSQLVVAGVGPLSFYNFGNIKKLEAQTFLDESNLTLRELLDRVIVKTEIKRWVLLRWGKNGEYVTLRC